MAAHEAAFSWPREGQCDFRFGNHTRPTQANGKLIASPQPMRPFSSSCIANVSRADRSWRASWTSALAMISCSCGYRGCSRNFTARWEIAGVTGTKAITDPPSALTNQVSAASGNTTRSCWTSYATSQQKIAETPTQSACPSTSRFCVFLYRAYTYPKPNGLSYCVER